MRWRATAFLAGAAFFPPGCANDPPVLLQVGGGGDRPCFARLEGRLISAQALEALGRRWRERGVQLAGDMSTPYRCMGGIIYALQRAGVERIGFVAQPAQE